MSSPSPLPSYYFDSSWGALASANFLLTICSLITAVGVGWNRLSGVAVAVSIFSLIANTMGWIGFNSGPTTKMEGSATRTVAYIFWSAQEIGCTFYSYFLLVVILSSRRASQTTLFLTVYWSLTFIYCAIRVSMISVFTQTWDDSPEHAPINARMWKITDNLNLAACVVLALIEMTTASLLIRDFHKAVKISQMCCSGRQVGLYKRLILSTEFRVASLAAIGITRAALMQPKRTSYAARGVDMFAVIAQNMYPAVLNLDQLMSRMLYIVDRPGPGNAQSVVTPRQFQAVEAATMGGTIKSVEQPTGLRSRAHYQGRNGGPSMFMIPDDLESTGSGKRSDHEAPIKMEDNQSRKDSDITNLTMTRTESNSNAHSNTLHTV